MYYTYYKTLKRIKEQNYITLKCQFSCECMNLDYYTCIQQTEKLYVCKSFLFRILFFFGS